MSIQITAVFRGAETVRAFDRATVAIGRPSEADTPDLDLSWDSCVSRHHALIFVEENACWIKDLGSRFGTQVNGARIPAQTKRRLEPTDTVLLGETSLHVCWLPTEAAIPPEPSPSTAAPGTSLRILQMRDTNQPLALGDTSSASATERRLALLLDLPMRFAAQSGQHELLQAIMDRVVEVIPAARRGALLLRDPRQDLLLLKAYVSADEPAVSETLARRALTEKRGFIWRSTPDFDKSRSIFQFNIVTGMYAPLQWQEEAFGVICVDSPDPGDSFQEHDLQFLIALGQFAGMALAEQRHAAEMRRNQQMVERLLANFSPKVRDVLLEQARQGKLRPGGIKSEVTVLFCDICDFTRHAARMDAHDGVDMLNDYFQPMLGAIFLHDGTLDKFVGDAVLAVFGSPEPDAQQHQKAVAAALTLQQTV